MKKKRKFAIIGLVIIIATFLTGCKGDEIEKPKVKWDYQERIEEITIKNEEDEGIYVTYEVSLLDKENEVIYIECFEEDYISDGESSDIDLEDVKPDYISYEKVESMEAKIIKVYEKESFWIWVIVVAIMVLFAAWLAWL